ncbi:MAG: ABC transporter permease [Acidimicrobiia bacterium]
MTRATKPAEPAAEPIGTPPMRPLAQVPLMLARNLREGIRNPVLAYLLPVVIPLGLLILVATTLKRVTDLPGFPTSNYAEWMMPGIVMMAAMTGVGYSATALVIDLQSGFLDRLRLLEARPISLLVSRLLFDVVRVLPAGVALLFIGLVLDTNINEGALGLVGLFALLALWAGAYCGLYFVVGLFTRNAQAPLALAPLFMPLSFLSTLYMPATLLPAWVRAAADWNPFTYMVDGARALTTGPFEADTVARAFAVAGGLLVVTVAVALWAFNRAAESA